ncbi:MAG: hypothetical protein KKA32_07495 [Actinobacteria bacterium]|nr:hypothetical protein [Actinomycetota bacterium]
MARSKGFDLVPKQVPTRQRVSFYKEIVEEFLKSGEQSVTIEGTDRKPLTLVQGLRKSLEAEGRSDVRVVQRAGDTYLVKD